MCKYENIKNTRVQSAKSLNSRVLIRPSDVYQLLSMPMTGSTVAWPGAELGAQCSPGAFAH